MAKRVYESDLRNLLERCFRTAYSYLGTESKLEISVNSIYAELSYNFPKPESVRNSGFTTFQNLLFKYCENNLEAHETENGIIIRVEYEIIPIE